MVIVVVSTCFQTSTNPENLSPCAFAKFKTLFEKQRKENDPTKNIRHFQHIFIYTHPALIKKSKRDRRDENHEVAPRFCRQLTMIRTILLSKYKKQVEVGSIVLPSIT
jgi:hypothetical protein